MYDSVPLVYESSSTSSVNFFYSNSAPTKLGNYSLNGLNYLGSLYVAFWVRIGVWDFGDLLGDYFDEGDDNYEDFY